MTFDTLVESWKNKIRIDNTGILEDGYSLKSYRVKIFK